MKQKINEILGWYGTFAILSAYALNSFGVVSAHNIWYQVLNITGSIGIIAISLSKKVYQPVVLNTIWAIIGVIGLVQVFFK